VIADAACSCATSETIGQRHEDNSQRSLVAVHESYTQNEPRGWHKTCDATL